jgi:hypothetical protein
VSKQTLGPGDLLVRTGAITFLVGAVGTVVTVAPFLLHTKRLPTPAYFVSMLMGLGLALALVGLLKAALGQRHAAVESSAALRERAKVRSAVREAAARQDQPGQDVPGQNAATRNAAGRNTAGETEEAGETAPGQKAAGLAPAARTATSQAAAER